MCELVPYQDQHRDGVIGVIRGVHDEYGFTWEADGYHRDLYDVQGHYLQPGGMFWALMHGDKVIGCAGVSLHGDHAELHRMYLQANHRGSGWGRKMLLKAIEFAKSRGCVAMELWSDVKLTDAHKLYLRSGFTQHGERICDDPDNSREYGFWKELL